MTGSQQERLSAYLDGELEPLERAALERELDASEELRRELAELAAIDEAARSLPVEAPDGYFDALPGRVRTRLQGTRPRRAAVPTWAWAAAAAVAVAAIAPLTMSRLQAPAPPAVASREEAPAAAPATRPPEAELREDAVAAPREALAAVEPDGRASSAEADTPAEGGAVTGRVAAVPAPTVAPQAAFATPPPMAAGTRTESLRAAPPPARQRAAGNAARAPEPGAGSVGRRAQSSPAREAPAADDAEEQAVAALADRGARATAADEPAAAGFAVGVDAEAFTALASRQVHEADEARALRESWRGFAARFPDSPLADEARVRAIESGVEAFRLGGADEDRERVRADVDAYLGRADAVQRGRVQALLAALDR